MSSPTALTVAPIGTVLPNSPVQSSSSGSKEKTDPNTPNLKLSNRIIPPSPSLEISAKLTNKKISYNVSGDNPYQRYFLVEKRTVKNRWLDSGEIVSYVISPTEKGINHFKVVTPTSKSEKEDLEKLPLWKGPDRLSSHSSPKEYLFDNFYDCKNKTFIIKTSSSPNCIKDVKEYIYPADLKAAYELEKKLKEIPRCNLPFDFKKFQVNIYSLFDENLIKKLVSGRELSQEEIQKLEDNYVVLKDNYVVLLIQKVLEKINESSLNKPQEDVEELFRLVVQVLDNELEFAGIRSPSVRIDELCRLLKRNVAEISHSLNLEGTEQNSQDIIERIANEICDQITKLKKEHEKLEIANENFKFWSSAGKTGFSTLIFSTFFGLIFTFLIPIPVIGTVIGVLIGLALGASVSPFWWEEESKVDSPEMAK